MLGNTEQLLALCDALYGAVGAIQLISSPVRVPRCLLLCVYIKDGTLPASVCYEWVVMLGKARCPCRFSPLQCSVTDMS